MRSLTYLLLLSLYSCSTLKKFVHITDVHYDPFYLPNTKDVEHCHRGSLTDSTTSTHHFGFPGEKCDSPASLIDGTFDFLVKNVANGVDFVLWTGDSSRHDRDSMKKKDPTEVYSQNAEVVRKMKLTFGKSPVFPAIGNWDVSPGDKLAQGPNDALNKLWESFQPLFSENPMQEEISKTFLKGGYYIADISEKFSIISLNTLYWMRQNDAVQECSRFGDDMPPVGSTIPGDEEFVWLNQVLAEKRSKNSQVFLIGHVPPHDALGSVLYYESCFHNFMHTIGAFSDVITMSYFGHINKNTLSMVLGERSPVKTKYASQHYKLVTIDPKSVHEIDLEKQQIKAIVQTSSSIIPVYNPSFKYGILELNSSIGAYVVEQKQFHLDIKTFNAKFDEEKNEPVLIYDSAKCNIRKNYGLRSLLPVDWEIWIKRIQKSGKRGGDDSNLIRRYMRCLYSCFEVEKYDDRELLSREEVLYFLICVGIFFMVAYLGILVYMKYFVEQETSVLERQHLLFRPVSSSRDRYSD